MRFATLAEWLAWQETLHPKSIDLGLERVRGVFRRLLPDPSWPFIITIGGTNGKGSCVAYLDAILRAQGYRVATYTSPHLLCYTERICIDGNPVDADRICAAFARVDEARRDTTLSFFEFGTLTALDIFSRENLDVQILEVGLGGRLDAVNIVDADAVLLASIDIDHQDWLGTTRESVGFEKAGVLRAGRPAVVADPDPPASLLHYAAMLPADLARSGRDFTFSTATTGWAWSSQNRHYGDLPLPALAGDHQLLNAAGVLKLLELIAEDRPVDEGAIRTGLENVRLRGRFQVIPDAVPIVLDVAHNPQAAGALAHHLRKCFPDRPIHAVFALMRDKDVVGVVDHLKALVARWYLPSLNVARASAPESLAHTLRSLGVERVEWAFPSVAAAVSSARAHARPDDLILVFGSFFLVAEYLAQRTDLPRC